MPNYDYRCLKCRKKFEMFQRITEEPIARHPKCGGKVERLIGAGAGLIFKGTGFYITDYKNKKASSGESKKPENSNGPKESKKPSKSDD